MSYMSKEDQARITGYSSYQQIFDGQHKTAFEFSSKSVKNKDGTDKDQMLYLVCNFGALISKVNADFLFGEEIQLKIPEDATEKQVDFIDELWNHNRLQTQLYESALTNSIKGDVGVKLRLTEDKKTVIDFIAPELIFVNHKNDDIRDTESIEICWKKIVDDNEYLRKEIHFKGRIENKLFVLDKGELKEIDLKILYPNLEPVIETGVDDFLIKLIPNWRISGEFWGRSDYHDLGTLFDEINNRMIRNSGTLNKHSDPKLAVPPGVLDEEGKVKRENFEMFEVSANQGGLVKPEYILWEASLEAAFKQIDKLIEMVFMFSETSPAVFGQDSGGVAESGRALKFRLLRTLAKISRKRNYYDEAIIWIFTTAQKLNKFKPVDIQVEWPDGMPNDTREQAEIEQIRLAAGNTSVESSIRRLDGGSDDEVAEEMKKIKEGTKDMFPGLGQNPPFDEEKKSNLKDEKNNPDNQKEDANTGGAKADVQKSVATK